jgi:hypothetical protein
MRKLAPLAALILLPTPLFALDVSFSGPTPEAMNGRELKIGTGAEPWEPVVIDYTQAGTALVRAPKDDEEPAAGRPFYRFEWMKKDKSAVKFFPMTPQEEIDRLRKLNDASIATAEGRALENSIVMAYINKGAVVRDCTANDREVPDALTVYVTLTPGQPQASAVVLPESDAADCVMKATERGTYPAVKAPFTARMRFGLSR